MKHGLSVCNLRGREGGHDGGFTLIELMVTIAIAAILASLAFPAVKELIDGGRLKSHSTTFHASLLLARSEAQKRDGRVVLCKSADSTADNPTCTMTGNWQQGWLIFAEPEDGNNGKLDSGEAIIQKIPALNGDFVLKGNGNVTNYVSYSSTGATKLVSGAFQSGTFTLCQPLVSNGKSRDIVISATGRPRVVAKTEATCSD